MPMVARALTCRGARGRQPHAPGTPHARPARARSRASRSNAACEARAIEAPLDERTRRDARRDPRVASGRQRRGHAERVVGRREGCPLAEQDLARVLELREHRLVVGGRDLQVLGRVRGWRRRSPRRDRGRSPHLRPRRARSARMRGGAPEGPRATSPPRPAPGASSASSAVTSTDAESRPCSASFRRSAASSRTSALPSAITRLSDGPKTTHERRHSRSAVPRSAPPAPADSRGRAPSAPAGSSRCRTRARRCRPGRSRGRCCGDRARRRRRARQDRRGPTGPAPAARRRRSRARPRRRRASRSG